MERKETVKVLYESPHCSRKQVSLSCIVQSEVTSSPNQLVTVARWTLHTLSSTIFSVSDMNKFSSIFGRYKFD